MHIQDFHSKLTTNEAPLFEALRGLSRIEDPSALFGAIPDPVVLGDWPQWPAMDAHSSDTALAGA